MKIKYKSKFDQLQKNAADLKRATSVPLKELMDNSFVSRCSGYASIEELFEASGFKVESKADFAAIPDHEWDDFITRETSYSGWSEMQQAALASYAQKILTKNL
jgi:hypothetical protein